MHSLLSYGGIALGSAIFALGINYFILANGLAEGGFTGIALILHYLFGLPVGMVLLFLNIPLLILGWYRWGKSFVLKTVLGVVAVSLAVDLTKGLALKTDDLLLAALYGGALSGIGIGMVLRSGATTGGVDIIARYFNEEKGLSFGKIYLAFDFLVLISVAFLFGLEKALYTLVAVYVFSQLVDKIVEGFDEAKAVTIISTKTQDIAQRVLKELDRGATVLPGQGAFTGQARQLLYVVVGRHQLLPLKQIVEGLDPQAFVIVSDVREVLGEGFPPRKKG